MAFLKAFLYLLATARVGSKRISSIIEKQLRTTNGGGGMRRKFTGQWERCYVSAMEVQSSRERRSCDERYNTRIDHCARLNFLKDFLPEILPAHVRPFATFPFRFVLSIGNVFTFHVHPPRLSHRMPALISPWAVADAPLLTSK